MAHFKCECGCEVFITSQAVKVDEGDFAVCYGPKSIKVDVVTAPVMLCIQCNRILVPSVTFPGKNRTSPEVLAYGEVRVAAAKRNETIK